MITVGSLHTVLDRRPVFRAIFRARLSILFVAITYAASIAAGIVMVHTGNSFALKSSDQLVSAAIRNDAAAIANLHGDPTRAVACDFAGNLFLGAIPKTISGFGIIMPFPMVVYQGWVGGIVSVRGDHTSRLTDPRSAAYVLVTLLLDVTAYSLAIGAGVNVGISLFRAPPYYQGPKWLCLFPAEALRDVGRIYVLVIPLFFVASLWEFLSPWNL